MSSHVILSGSNREHPADAAFMGKPSPDEILQITCILRRRAMRPKTPAAALIASTIRTNHGADPADIEAVERFANEHGFSMVRIDQAARAITLAGKFSALTEAFGADVDMRRVKATRIPSRQGSLWLHPCWRSSGCGIRIRSTACGSDTASYVAAYRSDGGLHTSTSCQAYNFPSNKGANQTIALIELGGGLRNSDLTTYWQQLSLPPVSVTAIGVDGATNSPSGDPASADGEVTLDIQVAGAVAPASQNRGLFCSQHRPRFLRWH